MSSASDSWWDGWPSLWYHEPIPALFHSLEFSGPFSQCTLCRTSLADDAGEGPVYMIERVFRGSEPIIEYAVCWNCRQDLSGGVSTESLQRLTAFFQDRVDLNGRSHSLVERYVRGHGSPDDWLDQCAVTGRTREQCRDYQVVAMCRGRSLVLGPFPLLLSQAAAEQMQAILSEATRGWMQDFASDNFGMPPEFCEDPQWKPVWF